MIRFAILLICLLITAGVAKAAEPTGVVSARLVDAADSTAVIGAVVELAPLKDSAQKRYNTSGARGIVSLTSVPYGEYKMTVSFLGYKSVEQSVTVNAPEVRLGRIAMHQESKMIKEIVLEGHAMRTSQKGDTVSYNADAFKVAKDADAEGLLSKLPGVRLVDGAVEAQGETVRKVFVDGKEFFGDDVTSAIKNLPAEAIAKIEVYNKQSDQAEFTGVDDGQSFKAINIVTRTDMRQGQFGKIYGGYGFNDYYIAGGNINIFSGDSRISLIGLANNLNQQNFSNEDILDVTGGSSGSSRRGGSSRGGSGRYSRGNSGFMVPQQSGISSVNSFGVNYSDQWGKKLTFQGQYFFNNSDNENQSERFEEEFSASETRRLTSSSAVSEATNFNHRFGARIEYKINENQSLMFRPSLSLQSNESKSLSQEYRGTGMFVENQDIFMSDTINRVKRDVTSDANGYNTSNFMLYRIKLGKPGRTVSVDGSLFASNNYSDTYDNTITHYYEPGKADSILNQHRISDVDRLSMRAGLMYTEPLTPKAQISLQYRYNYGDQPANRETYLWDKVNQRYSDVVDPELSNVFTNYSSTQEIGPGFNYSNQKTVLVFNLNYQNTLLTNDRTYPVPQSHLAKRFENVVYFGMLNQTFSPNNTLRVMLRSSTENPSVTQLQDVKEVSSPVNVSYGNPKLKPAYEHNLYMNYNRSLVTKGQTLMFMLGGSMRDNYIADSLINFDGKRTNYIVNMNGYRSIRTMVSFGTPVKFLRSNINFNAGVDYGRTPSFLNNEQNISSTFNYNGGAVLSSNISENLDFTLEYNIGFNNANNTINSRDDNNYLNQSAGGRVKWIFLRGFTLAANASYIKYSSGTNKDYNEEFCIINTTVGHKIFKNQRGEINIGVSDLLNQNRSYRRSFTDTAVVTQTNSIIGRYVGINLIYNLRHFGKRKPSSVTGGNSPQELREGGFRFGGPGGPGGGMPMGGPR